MSRPCLRAASSLWELWFLLSVFGRCLGSPGPGPMHGPPMPPLGPESHMKKPPITAAVGGYAVLRCDLEFPQDIEIPYVLNWNKENETIFSWRDGEVEALADYAERIQLLGPGPRGTGRASINLTAIRESDQGWYECRVYFPNRSPTLRNNGTWYLLEVEGNNLIGIPPVNQTTMEGSQAQFTCTPKSAEFVVTWLKDGMRLRDLPGLSARSWVGGEGALTISPAQSEDLGLYVCEVVSAEQDRQTAGAYLNVQYKAKVVYTKQEVYLPFGRSAILDCGFMANPPLTNLRWEKDGFLFDPYNVPGVFYRSNGSLFFSKVDEAHAGQYICIPYNSLGTNGPSPRISVRVQRPPAFTSIPRNLYLAKEGDSLVLPCDASDENNAHRPTIIWTKDGSELPAGRFEQVGGNLSLAHLTSADRGLYQCTASNEAATIMAETEIMIDNVPPRAPYNLAATTTRDSITLKWSPATSSHAINFRHQMEYQVWWKPAEVSEWRSLRTPLQANEVTISNLAPGREYNLRVLSQDRLGDGMFSKTISAWTKVTTDEEDNSISGSGAAAIAANAPPYLGPPLGVTVRLTPDGYSVEWQEPTRGLNFLRVYLISWYKGQEMLPEGSGETTNNYYLIDELEEDQVYQFQVSAISMNDEHVPSARVTLHVPAYGKLKAAVGGVAVLLLLVLLGAVYWFSKHRSSQPDKAPMTKANGEH